MPYLQVLLRLCMARTVSPDKVKRIQQPPRLLFLVWVANCLWLISPDWLAAQTGNSHSPGVVPVVVPASPASLSILPLHQRIDALVQQVAIGPLAPLAADADFLRRIYLDLTGVIPTAEQAREFLADAALDKRERLIDQLLQSPEFDRHFAVQWNIMLLDRRTDKYVEQKAWESYLIDSLARQKPLDQIFRELVYPDSLGDELTPARKFLLIRDAEPHAMTRDVGRLLFGMDLQCAQCHDHPLIGDYFQADYYGLFAFLYRTKLFEDPASKAGKLSELADGEAQYESVFTGDSDSATRPRLPKSTSVTSEPVYPETEAYEVKPDKTVAAKPKYSRRQALAARLADSAQFRRNLANRIWALVMGRGLVHPQDFHFADNPPTNPQLLELLASDVAQHGFDLRYAVRQLVLSQTYQRDCTPPRPETVNFSDIAARHSLLSEQLVRVNAEVQRLESTASAAHIARETALQANAEVVEKIAALQGKLNEFREQSTMADQQLTQAETGLAEQLQRARGIDLALTASRTALAQLADEPALQAALKLLQQRADELSAGVQQAQNQQAQQSTLAQTARQALQVATDELTQLQSQRAPPAELVAVEQSQLAATLALDGGRAQTHLLQRQLELCQALLDYPAVVAADPPQAVARWESIVEQWTNLGQVAPLKPLTPEQLAASAMQATGFLPRTVRAANSTVEKNSSTDAAQADLPTAEKGRLRAAAVQVELLDQLRGSSSQFVAQFGGLSGEEFQATVNQALFLGNSPALSGWLVAGDDTLVGRLIQIESSDEVAHELMLAVLSRPATLDEQREISTFLNTPGEHAAAERAQAVAEIAWALIASNEFRFNH